MEGFNAFYWLLGILALFLTIRNIGQVKGYNRERQFVNAYSKVLRQEDDAFEFIDKYLEEEKVDYLKNKAKVVKVYGMLADKKDTIDVIDSINFSTMFTDRGRFDRKKANRNSDIFVWLAMVIARANSLKKKDVINKLEEKLKPFEKDFDRQLEYKLFKGICSLSNKKNDEYTEFLPKLLDGDYSGMVYEQRLVGLYKRISASFLVSQKVNVDEYFENDLRSFAGTLVGKCLLQDLKLFDKYPPLEEEENEKVETKEVKKVATKKKATTKKVSTKKAPTKKTTTAKKPVAKKKTVKKVNKKK